MKEFSITIKVDDDFECGNCLNCRFSKDVSYSDHFKKWLYKCRLHNNGSYMVDKDSCMLKQ